MGKSKIAKKIGRKGNARSIKKVPKIKMKIKFQNSKKIPKTFLTPLQVWCRLRFAIWPNRLWVRSSQSCPYNMNSKKAFFHVNQKVLLWGAWNCNSRLRSLKVTHGQIFIKIWDMRVSGGGLICRGMPQYSARSQHQFTQLKQENRVLQSSTTRIVQRLNI